MSEQYSIVIGTLSIGTPYPPGYTAVAGHNYIYVLDENGNLVTEFNGLAYGEDGHEKMIGWKPSDNLIVTEDLGPGGHFYNPNHPHATLFEGTKAQVDALVDQARQAMVEMNALDLPYPPLGSGPNSNSVAKTLLDAMGLEKPVYDEPWTPYDDVNLLDDTSWEDLYDTLPDEIKEWIDNAKKWFDDEVTGPAREIIDEVGDWFDRARSFIQRRDPLTLDLDGDGIETVGADGSVLFDHDGDGVKSGTGWISPDDGLVVWDRNGNGNIDSGRELFGADTLLSDGSVASSGFQALADLDSNGDGVFSADDAEFGAIRIWKDANQDGVSQSSELLTLTETGVASINLTPTDTANVALGNGNVIDNRGTFTRTNGEEGQAGDLLLAMNHFYSDFSGSLDPVQITEEASQLPNLHGAGAVRNLAEAASLSADLLAAVQALTPGMGRDEMRLRMDQVLSLWASTSTMQSSEEMLEASGSGSRTIYFHGPVPSDIAQQGAAAVEAWKQQQHAELGQIISTLERFNGSSLVSFEGDRVSTGGNTFVWAASSQGGDPSEVMSIALRPEQIEGLLAAYDALKESLYGNLVLYTRLDSYRSSLEMKVIDGMLRYDASGISSQLNAKRSDDLGEAFKDVIDLYQYGRGLLSLAGWDGAAIIRDWVDTAGETPEGQLALIEAGIDYVSGSFTGTSSNNVIVGKDTNDVVNAGLGGDLLLGGIGSDVLHGGDGADVLIGEHGGDGLYGDAGDDTLYGGADEDALNGGEGNDRLDGGSGNDYLTGGQGSDLYIYNVGSGQDTISNYDMSADRRDVLRLGAGIDVSDVTATRNGTNLILSIAGTTDKITVSGYFVGDAAGGYQLDSIHFADGTAWDVDTIKSMVQVPTAGDDSIYGYATDEHLAGDAGNDMVDGSGGNDTLSGGDGNDALYGGDGTDNLDGGAGTDLLSGGEGSDTYLFARGSGSDTINNYDISSNRVDVLELGAGISVADVTITRGYGDSLVIKVDGTSDQITVTNYFDDDATGAYRLDEIRFADGTIWDITAVKALVQVPTSGDDTIFGYAINDDLSGAAGDDTLYGYGGEDTLQGGTGNDHLSGGSGADVLHGGDGSDTLMGDDGDDQLTGASGNDHLQGGQGEDGYFFTRGDGNDTIVDTQGLSTIHLSNLQSSEVYFRRDGSKLIIQFTTSPEDEIKLLNFFDSFTGLANLGLRVALADGSIWQLTPSELDAEVLKATALDDMILGNTLDNTIFGLGGRDTISAGEGNDIVHGGDDDDEILGDAGNDYLYGDAGNDALRGALGDDYLSGDAGNDTLYAGAGVDTLVGGDGADELYGEAGNDTLLGGEAADVLDGGLGADQMEGGAGDDVYIVDNAADLIEEHPGDGDDAIESSVSYYLPEHVEKLVLTGTESIDGRGNSADNELTGNAGSNLLEGLAGNDSLNGGAGVDTLLGGAGNDELDGGNGADTLAGGAGNDNYVVDTASDVVVELVGEGVDVVYAHGDYSLSENIEKLVLVEGTGAYQGTGNAGDEIIVGNSSSNRLDGAAGADQLSGGDGNDTYVVDNVGDQVLEIAGEGNDTVESSIDYTLGSTLENLTLLGSANLNGTGNDQDNTLIGNAGNNRLEGGLGGDSLYGGSGDDLYIEESDADWVYESVGEGLDTVERRFETNLILKDNVENLVLATGIQTGNGNDLANLITGNAGDNRLAGLDGDDELLGLEGNDSMWGGGGSDRLIGADGNDYLDGSEGIDHLEGGAGNDVYITDDASDVVVEAASGGTDQVQTTASYTLSANIENLFLTGDQAISGTGNALGNYLAGNTADNALSGMDGNDTLVGDAGSDSLIGGAGDDDYVVAVGSGTDVIDNTGGGFDGIFFEGTVTREQLSFSRDGDDLLISIDNNTTPAVRVTNHFLGGDAAIDFVQPGPAGSYYLTTAEINQIVAAGGGGGEYDQVIEGTVAGEQLVGSAGKDLVKGLAGDDTLFGMGGNDTLQGGDGADYLAGGNGSGTGSGDDRLEGDAGNDTLRGEEGANILIGGANDDSYVYGGGQDTIDNIGGGYDGVFFENGITAAQLAFTRDGDDLVITVDGDANATVRVTDHFVGGDAAIDFVQPATGSLLDTAAINALVDDGGTPPGGGDDDYPSVVTGTAVGEQLLGTNGRDLIKGLGGNDQLFGFSGDDKLEGGDGNDYLSGGNGMASNTGNDILIGGAGVDQLVGEDGDDQMFGGLGDDKYVYGGGADTIDNTGGGTDWLLFNSSAYSVESSRITFHRDGDDLIVRVDGDTDKQVRVIKHFLGGDYALAYVQPLDGYAIPASNFNDLLVLQPESSIGLSENVVPSLTGVRHDPGPTMSTGGRGSQSLKAEPPLSLGLPPDRDAPVMSGGLDPTVHAHRPHVATGGELGASLLPEQSNDAQAGLISRPNLREAIEWHDTWRFGSRYDRRAHELFDGPEFLDGSKRRSPAMSEGLRPDQVADPSLPEMVTGGVLHGMRLDLHGGEAASPRMGGAMVPQLRPPTIPPMVNWDSESIGGVGASSELQSLISAMAGFSPDAGGMDVFYMESELIQPQVAVASPL